MILEEQRPQQVLLHPVKQLRGSQVVNPGEEAPLAPRAAVPIQIQNYVAKKAIVLASLNMVSVRAEAIALINTWKTETESLGTGDR